MIAIASRTANKKNHNKQCFALHVYINRLSEQSEKTVYICFWKEPTSLVTLAEIRLEHRTLTSPAFDL